MHVNSSAYMHMKTTYKKPTYTIQKSTYFKYKINFDKLHICSFHDCICSFCMYIYVVFDNIHALITEFHVQHICSFMNIYVLCQKAYMLNLQHIKVNMYVAMRVTCTSISGYQIYSTRLYCFLIIFLIRLV